MPKRFTVVVLCLVFVLFSLSACKVNGKITVVDKAGKTVFEAESFSYDDWKKKAGDRFSFVKSAAAEAVSDIAQKNGVDEKSAQNFLLENNCRIETSFDSDCFKAAKAAYSKVLEDSVEFCLVLTNKSGSVLATYNNSPSGTDNPTDLKNPYSTIKPLSVYAPALEAVVINWATMFEDSEYKKIKGQDGKFYSWPANATNRYEGKDVTVAYGVKQSLNTVAVKCLKKLGVKNSISFLRSNFGINLEEESRKAEIYGEEEILGNIAMGYLSNGVTAVDIAGFYSVFENDGEYIKPHFVSRIVDEGGKTVFSTEQNSKKIIEADTAYIMNRMLADVVSPGGTGEKAAVKGLEICGKTGTGNGNEGNWFVGFSPNYLCAVWHGPQMGENKAPQVFSSLFSAIPQNNTRFIRREDIRQAAYCAESGKLLSEGCRNIEVGYFTSDNIPEKCDVHK